MVSFIITLSFITCLIISTTYYYYLSADELEEKLELYKDLLIRAKNLYKSKKSKKGFK